MSISDERRRLQQESLSQLMGSAMPRLQPQGWGTVPVVEMKSPVNIGGVKGTTAAKSDPDMYARITEEMASAEKEISETLEAQRLLMQNAERAMAYSFKRRLAASAEITAERPIPAPKPEQPTLSFAPVRRRILLAD